MLSEKELKDKGEEIAQAAIDVGVAFNQLKMLYKLAKTKPVPFLEAFVKRQMARNVVGFDSFGPVILELLEECTENKMTIQKILIYANMLYQYIERKDIMELKQEIEPVIRRIVERFGYRGVKILERNRGDVEFRVNLMAFHGNPARLASGISCELKKIPAVSKLRFYVWIEKTEKR